MNPYIIIENVRSAYNVGNIIRTADAIGYDVILSGFSPTPGANPSVHKTALGAEEHVQLQQFRDTHAALVRAQQQGYMLVASELVDGVSQDISLFLEQYTQGSVDRTSMTPFALIVGNETTGILAETLEIADAIVHIPMQGEKESLNVGQAAAIMMWACAQTMK